MIGGLTRRSLMSAVTAMSTHVVTEAPPVGPAAGHDAVAEPGLHLADQRVAAEDAEPREAGIVGIGRMAGAAAGQPRRAGRQIDLDQIGDEDAGDVGAVRRRARRSP